MVYIHAYPIIIDNNIAMINRCGGHIEEAASIPEEQEREAVRGAVCRVNIASDGWLVLTAIIRKMLHKNHANFYPRKYMGPAQDELVQEYMRKNHEVFGSVQSVSFIDIAVAESSNRTR